MNTTDSNATSDTVPLDAALEAITVAISLGMKVPAVHGMQVWTAFFESNHEDDDYELEVASCISEEVALAHMRNLMLPQLVRSLSKNPILLRATHRKPTLAEYIEDTSTRDLIRDYEHMYDVRFHCWVETVSGVAPTPLTHESCEGIISGYSAK